MEVVDSSDVSPRRGTDRGEVLEDGRSGEIEQLGDFK